MPRVLVIDDDSTLCKLLFEVFTMLKFDVNVAYNGEEGLRIAKEHKPDVVILDINMPAMNGYEVCTRLRAEPETRDVPVLMLTGLSHLPAAMKGLATGANDYITKPFNIDEVAARVQALLARRR